MLFPRGCPVTARLGGSKSHHPNHEDLVGPSHIILIMISWDFGESIEDLVGPSHIILIMISWDFGESIEDLVGPSHIILIMISWDFWESIEEVNWWIQVRYSRGFSFPASHYL